MVLGLSVIAAGLERHLSHEEVDRVSPKPNDDTANLISAARQGDLSAQAQLMQTYESYLRLLARLQVNQQLRGRVSASDVVQDVFLRANEHFGEFRGTTEHEFVAWLRRILASQLISLARHHLAGRRDARLERQLDAAVEQSSVAVAACLAIDADSPSCQATNREQGVLLAEALDELPPDYREVIVQRHLEEMSFADIAEKMGRTVPSVKSIWTRAVAKLRTRLIEGEPS